MHNCGMQNWDDLRFFLAAARSASLRGAARTLGVNQSTVARRLNQLEANMGTTLFERRARGLALTDVGHDIVAEAESIEESYAALDRKILGRDARLSGRIRLSVADGLVPLVGSLIAEMRQLHPAIQIEVGVGNALASLSNLEADIVLRVTTSPPEHLIGRRIAQLTVAAYGSRDYLATSTTVGRLEDHRWIRWAERWQDFGTERWIGAHVSPSNVQATVNTNQALSDLVLQGLGLAFLPCFSADADPKLVRIGSRVESGASVWLLTHDDLRKSGRVAAFMKLAGERLLGRRPEIEGPFPEDEPASESPLGTSADSLDTFHDSLP